LHFNIGDTAKTNIKKKKLYKKKTKKSPLPFKQTLFTNQKQEELKSVYSKAEARHLL